ncbi:MAG TPA: autotransporter-associated beta strand repeat-containing protein, partial [Bryobacteraceae bacterium]
GVGLYYLGSKSLTIGGNNSFGDVSGVIADGGGNGGTGGSIVKTGTGTYFFTGANTYTGATTVSAGTLEIGNGTVGSLASVSAVKVAANATLALDLPDGATFANSVANAGHVVADETTSNNYTIAGIISGTGNLTKIKTNTVALTGANTYSGGTVVSGGILTADNPVGSATGTGTVTVNGGGTFGGSGKVTGAMTLNSGGTVAPGAAFSGTPGATLHGSSLIWNGGGTVTLQLGASASDTLALTGALTKGSAGAYKLDLINAGLVSTDTYNLTLLTFASTTFSLADFTIELPVNYTGTLVETKTSLMIENLVDPPPSVESPALAAPGSTENTLDTPATLTVTPTPEPGSATLLAFGAGALIGWRRRKMQAGG